MHWSAASFMALACGVAHHHATSVSRASAARCGSRHSHVGLRNQVYSCEMYGTCLVAGDVMTIYTNARLRETPY